MYKDVSTSEPIVFPDQLAHAVSRAHYLAKDISSKILKTPDEWSKEYEIKVIDEDGWRHDLKSWTEPIDEQEWLTRMAESTCSFSKKALDILKDK